MSLVLVRPSNHLILCHPLLILQSAFSSIRFFSNESALHIRWSKYWNFRFNISPSSEYSGLISFRMDWLDLLAVQGTLKSLLHRGDGQEELPLSPRPRAVVGRSNCTTEARGGGRQDQPQVQGAVAARVQEGLE